MPTQSDQPVYSYVPRQALDTIMSEGLYSGTALLKRPDLINLLARSRGIPEKRFSRKFINEITGLNKHERNSVRGPNIVFQPPPEDIKLAPAHPMNKWDLIRLKINLAQLQKDYPKLRIHGQELFPYSENEYKRLGPVDYEQARHHDLSSQELDKLRQLSAKELWKHYSDKQNKGFYAADVPHASLITRSGIIKPKYLSVDEEKQADETLRKKKQKSNLEKYLPYLGAAAFTPGAVYNTAKAFNRGMLQQPFAVGSLLGEKEPTLLRGPIATGNITSMNDTRGAFMVPAATEDVRDPMHHFYINKLQDIKDYVEKVKSQGYSPDVMMFPGHGDPITSVISSERKPLVAMHSAGPNAVKNVEQTFDPESLSSEDYILNNYKPYQSSSLNARDFMSSFDHYNHRRIDLPVKDVIKELGEIAKKKIILEGCNEGFCGPHGIKNMRSGQLVPYENMEPGFTSAAGANKEPMKGIAESISKETNVPVSAARGNTRGNILGLTSTPSSEHFADKRFGLGQPGEAVNFTPEGGVERVQSPYGPGDSRATLDPMMIKQIPNSLYNLGAPAALAGALLSPTLSTENTARNVALASSLMSLPMLAQEAQAAHGLAQGRMQFNPDHKLWEGMKGYGHLLPYLSLASLPLTSHYIAKVLGRWEGKENKNHTDQMLGTIGGLGAGLAGGEYLRSQYGQNMPWYMQLPALAGTGVAGALTGRYGLHALNKWLKNKKEEKKEKA